MALDERQITGIGGTIRESLRNKLSNYKPETNHMPFHYRLIGKDRMALFSFIHSLNTTFGTSIFEPAAEALAKPNFRSVNKQYEVGNKISKRSQSEIQSIINDLTTGKDPDKKAESERIRKVCNSGSMEELQTVKVDLYAQSFDGVVHLFNLKPAKPNISDFKDFKRTLLEWTAIFLANNPQARVNSYIAIPYNPYEPKPYERWTLKGMLDLENELKVAEEFWDFLGSEGTYEDLLGCFEKVGVGMKEEISDYFQRFNQVLI